MQNIKLTKQNSKKFLGMDLYQISSLIILAIIALTLISSLLFSNIGSAVSSIGSSDKTIETKIKCDHDDTYSIDLRYTNSNTGAIMELYDDKGNIMTQYSSYYIDDLLPYSNGTSTFIDSHYGLEKDKEYTLKLHGDVGYWDATIKCSCGKTWALKLNGKDVVLDKELFEEYNKKFEDLLESDEYKKQKEEDYPSGIYFKDNGDAATIIGGSN